MWSAERRRRRIQAYVLGVSASQCGYTPQYAGLQELWKRYRGRGLLIVGVPSNDFGGQEPGSAADIAETAQHHYDEPGNRSAHLRPGI
jgi:glutathione peroxidase-family protein